jgi:hypothetical protein
MRDLASVHQEGILHLAAIANQTTIAQDNAASQIGSFAYLTLLANYAWSFDHSAMLNCGFCTDVDLFLIDEMN